MRAGSMLCAMLGILLVSGDDLDAQVRRTTPPRGQYQDILERLEEMARADGLRVVEAGAKIPPPVRVDGEILEHRCATHEVPLCYIRTRNPVHEVFYCGVDGYFWWLVKEGQMKGPGKIALTWRYKEIETAILQFFNDLGSESFEQRERAHRLLVLIGPMASPVLEKFLLERSGGGSTERALRVGKILKQIWAGRQLMVRDLGGERADQSVESTRATVRVVLFWALWSDSSLRELSDLARIQREFRSRGVRVIGCCRGGNFDVIYPMASSMGVEFTIYFNVSVDDDQGDFGQISSFPTTFVIDRSGTQERLEGRRGYEALKKSIEKCLGNS